MICFPNAKINLGLRIIEKRPDGYHNLETVFYPIGLKDALESVPNTHQAEFTLSVSGLNGTETSCKPAENLVTKAFRLIQSKYHIQPSDFFLHKAIPTGAGLGGGSSDAAFTLQMINEINNLGLSNNELEVFSAHLGADCAFFIKNNPIFASGIGTVFEDIALSLKGYFLVLVKPDVHVSTAEAYSLVHPARPEFSLKKVLTDPISTWKNTVVNDFEVSVFERYPQIRSIKEQMYLNGAIYTSMSGSGSSVFGLFSQPIDLRQSFPDCFYWSETLA
ncbi:MAG: 4-(cytidine 5'-diphospho)-2-C-methyl-D-erythritol kinase [Bacteroidales bacterium]|nr:4-(cytidine 5'-diphospho)-2-C-methyl-D-erythritol kinase [Bacteroidales bacterium]